jgi:putative FmdB family regulatory protein
MPIFEYKCEDCGTSFEKLVRNGAEVACPSCGEHHLKQQFSTFSAHANGAPKAKDMMPSCPGGMCATPDLCGRN